MWSTETSNRQTSWLMKTTRSSWLTLDLQLSFKLANSWKAPVVLSSLWHQSKSWVSTVRKLIFGHSEFACMNLFVVKDPLKNQNERTWIKRFTLKQCIIYLQIYSSMTKHLMKSRFNARICSRIYSKSTPVYDLALSKHFSMNGSLCLTTNRSRKKTSVNQ